MGFYSWNTASIKVGNSTHCWIWREQSDLSPLGWPVNRDVLIGILMSCVDRVKWNMNKQVLVEK